MIRPRAVGATVLLVLAAGLATNPPEPAAADTVITPTTAHDERDADDGKLTLREAITQANETPGQDTILLGEYRQYTIGGTCDFDGTIEAPELTVTDPAGLIIDGNGSTIRQTGPGGAFCPNRVMRNGTGPLELRAVSLTGGHAEYFCHPHPNCWIQPDWGRGGGLYSLGPVLLTDHTDITGNDADRSGGGVYVDGSLTLVDANVSYNTAGIGGGIRATGTVTLDDSAVVANRAVAWEELGALYTGSAGGVSAGTAIEMTDSLISDNVAEGVNLYVAGAAIGGGLVAPTVTATSSMIRQNEAQTGYSTYLARYEPGRGGAISAGSVILDRTSVLYNIAEDGAAMEGTTLASTMSVIGGEPGSVSCALSGATTSGGYNVVGGGTCGLGSGVGDRTHVPVPMQRSFGNVTPPTDGVLSIIPPAECGPEPDWEGQPRPQGGACEAGADEVAGAAGPHATPTVLSPNGLGDVDPSADDAVDWATTHGVLTGSGGAFRPSQAVTRGQAVAALWRMMGSTRAPGQSMPFVDVPRGATYRPALKWALAHGVVAGTAGSRYRPKDAIDRATFVSMLWRVAGAPTQVFAGSPWPRAFTDVSDGAAYASAANWAAYLDLVPDEDHVFRPTKAVRRWTAAQILYLAASTPRVWDTTPAPPTNNL